MTFLAFVLRVAVPKSNEERYDKTAVHFISSDRQPRRIINFRGKITRASNERVINFLRAANKVATRGYIVYYKIDPVD